MENRYSQFHFRDQQPDEIIYSIIRRHWFDIFLQYIPVMGALFLLLAVAASSGLWMSESSPEGESALFFFESLFLLMLWMYASLIFVDYYLDVWIVTDRRVINIEQKGLFSRQVSELYYAKIQDVTTEVKGLFPTFLNYGDLFVQTAAEKERFRFHNIPNPYEVKDLVMRLQKEGRGDELSQLREVMHGNEG
jgi:uncharacterized membrane protein YdbT with pleckstrin-like domain